MTTSPDRDIANMSGEASLPRKNGELVFNAPWEGRSFGMAVGMNSQGLYGWGDFRDHLVAEIAHAEKKGTLSTYYEQWLASLEKLAIEKGFVTKEELDRRTSEYASGQRSDEED